MDILSSCSEKCPPWVKHCRNVDPKFADALRTVTDKHEWQSITLSKYDLFRPCQIVSTVFHKWFEPYIYPGAFFPLYVLILNGTG